MEQARILVVDDDLEIAKAIEMLLTLEGYEVIKAYNGYEALDVLMNETVHLILLDVMMPKLDGLSTTLKVREQRNIPIIILSAKSEDSDKVLGLSMGADDYVTKPFSSQELVARVKSQLRRYLQLGDMGCINKDKTLINGGLKLDLDAMQLTVDGELVKLTAKELKI